MYWLHQKQPQDGETVEVQSRFAQPNGPWHKGYRWRRAAPWNFGVFDVAGDHVFVVNSISDACNYFWRPLQTSTIPPAVARSSRAIDRSGARTLKAAGDKGFTDREGWHRPIGLTSAAKVSDIRRRWLGGDTAAPVVSVKVEKTMLGLFAFQHGYRDHSLRRGKGREQFVNLLRDALKEFAIAWDDDRFEQQASAFLAAED